MHAFILFATGNEEPCRKRWRGWAVGRGEMHPAVYCHVFDSSRDGEVVGLEMAICTAAQRQRVRG